MSEVCVVAVADDFLKKKKGRAVHAHIELYGSLCCFCQTREYNIAVISSRDSRTSSPGNRVSRPVICT